MLANQMAPTYRFENCAVLCLNDGGVMVGVQIAMKLHCIITLLVTDNITLPREIDAIAGITSDGTFTYNKKYSQGEIDELAGEYRTYIEEEKLNKLHDINHVPGNSTLTPVKMLKNHTVILVSDGLSDSMQLDLASEFLKPIAIEKLVVATPVASIPVIDKIHVMADAVFCLNVVEDYISTDHYYDKHDIPDHKTILETIENIILHWS